MKPVIVFVDDEPNILQGIRRYTRSQRGSWDMHFLESGKTAMELVAQTPVDVIVSDMRMPEITGADLLEHISHEAPGIIRLILSGEAEEAQTHRTIGRSHRFIAKPCDPTLLINEINAILSLRQKLGYKTATECVSIFDELKSPASVFVKLQDVLSKDDPTLEDITQVIEDDPSLAARVLQLVNSAYFGRPLSTVSIKRAIKTIGVPSLRRLLELERLGNAGPQRADKDEALAQYLKATELGKHVSKKLQQTGCDELTCDFAYATGLFAMLGAIGIKAEENMSKATVRAAYIARLFGLPEQLIESLLHLPEFSPHDSLDDLTQCIKGAVMTVETKAA